MRRRSESTGMPDLKPLGAASLPWQHWLQGYAAVGVPIPKLLSRGRAGRIAA
jgi:hypothetical protein